MSAQPKVNETATQPVTITEVPQTSNGKQNYAMPGPRRETPPLKSDDSLLHDTLAFMMQQAADDRRITNALLEKMVNGNGSSKISTMIKTVVAVVGLAVVIVAYIVTITNSNRDLVKDVQGLQSDKQRLEQTVDRLNEKFGNLEKLYMIEFGRDPDAAGNKDQKKR